jgi:hypothetical protein
MSDHLHLGEWTNLGDQALAYRRMDAHTEWLLI